MLVVLGHGVELIVDQARPKVEDPRLYRQKGFVLHCQLHGVIKKYVSKSTEMIAMAKDPRVDRGRPGGQTHSKTARVKLVHIDGLQP